MAIGKTANISGPGSAVSLGDRAFAGHPSHRSPATPGTDGTEGKALKGGIATESGNAVELWRWGPIVVGP